MSQHCKANPCCGDRPCSGVPLPQHTSGLTHHNKKPEATEGATPSPLTCQCANTITDPCIVCGKGKTLVTAEWLQKMAAKEGDLEIGAGRPDYAAEADRLRAIALDMQNGYIALKGLVERAQAIISKSIYPNWHEAARAALTAKEGGE